MKLTGTITLDRIRIHANHGVSDQERLVGNDYEVSISVIYPMERAMLDDELDGTVNYASLAELVKAVMSVPSKLLENVVYRLYHEVVMQFPAVTGGSITVTKLTPPMRAELAGASVSFSW